uniref:Protein draper-like n=1 Tax=Crassostrea virginica TaxID=6565 RepID=A0A8B8BYS9_CRAVI|nr:protein draper-like [Crassostrea virginica]
MIACDNAYGLGCREPCGNCLDLKPCDHTNGSCINGCAAGFKGDTCKEVCDFGYYGMKCLQECSSFCKLLKNCHHVSGHCIDGCKNGWQGMDCLEVESEKQSFYGVLGVLCGSLLLNGIFIAYIIILRKSRNRRSKQHHTNTKTLNTIAGEHDKNVPNVNDGYQELGEIGNNDTTYDVVQ